MSVVEPFARFYYQTAAIAFARRLFVDPPAAVSAPRITGFRNFIPRTSCICARRHVTSDFCVAARAITATK